MQKMRLPICSCKAERKEQTRKTTGGLDVRVWLFFPNHCQIFQSQRSFGVRVGEEFCGKKYSKPTPIDDSVVIELDEMRHFVHSKKDKFGFGKLIAEPQNSSSMGNAEHEMLKHLEKCTSD